MFEFDIKKLVACAMYAIAYVAVFYFAGSFDNAYDAASIPNSIDKHYAEYALSAIYELAFIVGLVSLWLYGVETWVGGVAVGLLTSMAAGGFHVFTYVGAWLMPAAVIGAVCGFVAFVLPRKPPAVCALLATEITLALAQVALLVA